MGGWGTEDNIYCINEKYFEDFFVAKGYDVISPEELSLTEQISLVSGAEKIACTLGTLAHWLLFCRPNTEITVLTRVDYTVLPPQCLINEAKQADWHIVDVSMNLFWGKRVGYSVVLLGPNKHWRKFVADRYGETLTNTDADVYRENLYEYFLVWCERAIRKDNLTMLDSFDFVAMFNKTYSKLTGKDLPEGHLTLSPKMQAAVEEINAWKIRAERAENKLRLLQNLANDRPTMCYEAHIMDMGQTKLFGDGEICGDGQHAIDTFRLSFVNATNAECHVSVLQGGAWSADVGAGETAGVFGKAITGLKIAVTGDNFAVAYRIFTENLGWSDEIQNGTAIASNNNITAIIVRIV